MGIDELKDTILQLEKQLMHYRKEDFEKLLAEDFLEYGSSGKKYDKRFLLDYLDGKTGLKQIPFHIYDFQIKVLSSEWVHVTFCTEAIDHGNKSLRSSIWKLYDGHWQMFFHQGTPTK